MNGEDAGMDLADFLLARIADDEAQAKLPEQGWLDMAEELPIGCWDEKRVLAECEAKRRIVERHGHRSQWVEDDRDAQVCTECGSAGSNWPVLWPCPTLRLLVPPYADHADYRSEWAP